MNLRLILLSTAALFAANASFAQDEIHKRNGDVIEGRVRDVSKTTIRYILNDEVGAPEYQMDRSEVKKIEYEDGTVERFSNTTYKERLGDMEETHDADGDDHHHGRKHRRNNKNYGNNILAISPLQISESGMGVGLSYERVLDKNGIISFYLPVAFTFSGNGDGYYNDELYNFYVMPGLKIYPTGSKGVVKYSIGPSFIFVAGEDYYDYGYPYYYGGGTYGYPYYYEPIGDRFTFGMMVNNTLNINPTEHLHMGLELGLGLSYLKYVNGIRQDTEGLVQFGFKVGYRW